MFLLQGGLIPDPAAPAVTWSGERTTTGVAPAVVWSGDQAATGEVDGGQPRSDSSAADSSEAYPPRSAQPVTPGTPGGSGMVAGDLAGGLGQSDIARPNPYRSMDSLASALAAARLGQDGAVGQRLTAPESGRHFETQGTVGLPWSGYGHDAQHSGISDNPSVPLTHILWQTPVDRNIPSGEILVHYASPLVTAYNTVIVAVKVGLNGPFQVEGIEGGTGRLKWTVNTDFTTTQRGWTPALPVTLDPYGRLYIAAAGGRVQYIDNPDADGATISGTLAFYDISRYTPDLNSKVYIDTPLTSDSQGDLFFGYQITQPALGLSSGIARMAGDGSGTWVSAQAAAGGDGSIRNVAQSSAPALSPDEASLYVTVSTSSGGGGTGYLTLLDSTTLTPINRVRLNDAATGAPARVDDSSTASPTVGPDGDVYIGVLENPFPANNDRGWLLHFSADLTQSRTPGAFGWDDTPSIVPSYLVPSYQGASSYLIMSKYNNYAGIGGDGVNKVAVLDPNDTMRDPITGATVMSEVLTVVGPTPDPDYRPRYPNAVREWCINAAAVDPFNGSVLVNSEDGALYRWDLASNSLTEGVQLAPPRGEAYTPTVIGPDGTTYAINNGIMFAVG